MIISGRVDRAVRGRGHLNLLCGSSTDPQFELDWNYPRSRPGLRFLSGFATLLGQTHPKV